MKKSFRAAVSVLFALTFAVVGLSSVMFVDADYTVPEFTAENLALRNDKGGHQNPTAFSSSVYSDWEKRKPTNALDGTGDKNEDDNYFQPSTTGDEYLGVYWANAQTFDTVVVRWKDGSKTTVNSVAIAADYGVTTEKNLNPTTDYSLNTGTVVSSDSKNIGVDVITFNAPVTAEMVKVNFSGSFPGCGNAPTPGEILSIEVYNTNVEETVIGNGNVEAETAVVGGVKSVFVATNVAEADLSANACIKASYTITKADGTEAKGVKFITSAYKSIALGEEVITAEDADDYVTGILFNNVNEDATVKVVFTVAYN